MLGRAALGFPAMRKYRGCRLQRKIGLAIVLVILVCYIVCLVTHSNGFRENTKRSGDADLLEKPYRFPLSHSWAWHDDVIHINDLAPDHAVSARAVQDRISPLPGNESKSPSVSQYGAEYGTGPGGNVFALEGVEDYILSRDNREPQKLQTAQLIKRIERCTYPIQNVLLLKTHYTGSDVISNILNRFADLRDLKVAIPNGGVSTFYWPARFHWRHLDLGILDGALPNVLTCYARYNGEIMDQIMHPGSAYISIIREPLKNFESTFRNLDYASALDMEDPDPMAAFLENPKMHIEHVIKMRMFKDPLNLIKNGMFFDLGLRTADYHKPEVVKDAILDIDAKFTLILIYEYLDESLVMLKRKLCWELDDVVYLKAQYLNHEHHARKSFSSSEKAALKNWSKADVALYEYFNKTLWQRISYEEPEFSKDLAVFRERQRTIEADCSNYEQTAGSALGLNGDMNQYLCQKMKLSDVNYLQYFRAKLTAFKLSNVYT